MSDFLVHIGGDASGLTSAMENAKREIVGILAEIRAAAGAPLPGPPVPGTATISSQEAAGRLTGVATTAAQGIAAATGAGGDPNDIRRYREYLQKRINEVASVGGFAAPDIREILRKFRSGTEKASRAIAEGAEYEERFNKFRLKSLAEKAGTAAGTEENRLNKKRFAASEEGYQQQLELNKLDAQAAINKQRAANQVIQEKLAGKFQDHEGQPIDAIQEDGRSRYLAEKYNRQVDIAKLGHVGADDVLEAADLQLKTQRLKLAENLTIENQVTEADIANRAELVTQVRRHAVAEERAVLQNVTAEDILQEATLAVTRNRIKLAEDAAAEQQVTKADIAGRAEYAALKKRHAVQEDAIEAEILAADKAYIEATIQTAVSRKRTAAKIEEGQLSALTQEDYARKGRIDQQREVNKARTELARGGITDGELTLATPSEIIGRGDAARDTRKAEVEAARLAELTDAESAISQRYIASKAEAAASQERLTNAIKAETQSQTTEADLSQRTEIERRQKLETLVVQVQTLRRNLGLEEVEGLLQKSAVELEAQKNVLSKQYNAQVVTKARTDAQEQGYAGKDATIFQRLQARFRSRVTGANGGVPVDPTELPTLGQFAFGKALTTVGFAASGFAFYGAIQGVKTLLDDAKELEKQFSLLQAQFAAVDQAGEFPKFKKGILDIASSTGESVQNTIQIASQLKGAFGNNNDEALRQTESLVKAAKVTGITAHEAIDNFTAVTRTYGVSVENVSDLTLGLQDRFGVLAKESVQFLGQLAPTAKEAGLSLHELGAVAATAQEYSGRSGTAIAESLGRILPSLQANVLKLKDVVKLDPKDVASGDLGNIFFDVIKQYDGLSGANKRYVAELLGGKREAQTLNAIFGHSSQLLGEVARKTDDAGRTQKSFAEIQKSLSQTLSELRQKFTEFALKVYEAGVGDFLKDLVRLFELLAGAIGKLASIPGMKQLVELLLLVKAVSIVRGLSVFDGLGTKIGNIRTSVSSRFGAETFIPGSRFGEQGLGSFGASKELANLSGREVPGALTRFRAGLNGAEVASTGFAGSMGALVASIGPAIAAFLAFAAVQQYLDLRNHEGGQDKSYGDSLRGASRDELRRALAPGGQTSGTSVQESTRARLTGSRTNREQVQAELRKRDSESLAYEIRDAQSKNYQKIINDTFNDDSFQRELAKLGLDQGGTINRLAQQARDHPSNAAYYKALKDFILKLRKKLPKDVADQILKDAQIHVDDQGNVLTDDDLKSQAEKKNQDQIDNLAESVKTAQEQYNAGLISYDDYIKSLRTDIKFLNDTKDAGGGKLSEANQKQLTDDMKQLAQVTKTQYDARISIRESLGDLNPQQKIALLQQELNDPDIQSNRDTMIQVANDLTSAIKAFFDHEVKNAGSLEEALQVQKGGRRIPPELKAALEKQLKALGVENPDIPGFIKEDPEVIAQREADLRKQVNEAQAQKATADAHGDKVKGASTARDKALADLYAAEHDKLGDSQSRQAAILQAKSALEQADDAVTEALQSRLDAVDAIAEANAKYNPVQAAVIRLQTAQRHLREAKNKDEQLAAQLQLIQSQQSLAELISDTITAQANLGAAVAEAAGNSADAIRIRLADTQRKLSELAAKGGYGSAEYKNMEAEIVNQQHSLETTLRNDQKDYYEFLYATKQITATQLIQYLEGLASGINQNTQEWRSLQQEIYNLKHQMSSNLAFNLPNEFNLPTLYEVRRLNQGANSGYGYTDNRQQVVNVYVTNGMSPAAVTQAVSGALSTGSRRYGVA